MKARLSEFSGIVGGELRGDDVAFEDLSIDTRSLKPGDLYLAIRGTRFDGNDFVAQAKSAGASAAVVERFADCDLPQVRVDDGRMALGSFAASWRDRWTGRLVGITGSNGKTTVKEMTAAILGVAAPALKTQGNLNNDIGVPLMLLRLTDEHRFAVIEMGANHPGEIAYVSGVAKPDVAVISNAGAAHLEGFGSLEGVASAKGELIASLGSAGTAVLNADDRFFGRWCEMAGGRPVVSFGFGADAAVRADADSIRMGLSEGKFLTTFDLLYRGERHPLALSLAGDHNVINALAAAAAACALGFDIGQIRTGLSRVTPVPGRVEPVTGIRGSLLINDTYNANPASFRAALHVLRQLSGEHWVALGAFGELGEASAELHAEIGGQARAMGVTRLFAVGPNADRAVEAFGEGALYCREQDELIELIQQQINENVVLLIKGSRAQRMERVVDALWQRSDLCC
jgi:UDP-N-acetylmuramoyl-tripeptide--D-alanyl-D-alanine ligase